jgi:hypothetical protein
MAEAGSLAYCLDESMGRPLAKALRELRAPGSPQIHDLRELGLSGVTDEVMMRQLRGRSIDVVVTRDSRILTATVRRDVWRTVGLSLFVLDGKWGNLRLFEQARRLFWWWPAIASQAETGPTGAAWRISTEMREDTMQRMFPDIGAA